MRKVILFIAMSLDGYIADCQGGVGWLQGQNQQEEGEDTYSAFIQRVDTVVMGWNTYDQIVTELSPDQRVYDQQTSYVITHRSLPSTGKIIFTSKSPCLLVKELKQKEGKNIWICGGAKVAEQLMDEDLIDRYEISVIPVILGSGIPLFGGVRKEIPLALVDVQQDNGIVNMIYTRR